MASGWRFAELDARIAAEVAEFLPERIFDAHAHLARRRDIPDLPGLLRRGPQNVTPRQWRLRLGRQVGEGRLAGALFMPYPTPQADVGLLNRRLLADLDATPEARGALLVTPDERPGELAALAEHPQVVGLKPYHFYARTANTLQAPLASYLPEWAWRLADQRGLTIVIHLVRTGALADEHNRRALREMCTRYPGARAQLAHAARGFHAPNTVRHVAEIADLPNVYFDSSAICEASPLVAIIRACGPERLLWGSDFPVSELRGRPVTVGDGFLWLDEDTVRWELVRRLGRPTLAGLEALRALREACELTELRPRQVRAVFHGNARRLYGITG